MAESKDTQRPSKPAATIEEVNRVLGVGRLLLTVLTAEELEELVDNEIGSIKDQGGDPDFGIALLRSLKDSGLRYRFGTVPMDTSIEDTRKWVDVEIRYLERQGREIPAVDPELFHVPFIWAVIDLS